MKKIKKKHLVWLLLFYCGSVMSQQTEWHDDKIYIGAEAGLNYIASYSLGERKIHPNYGITFQYEFSKYFYILAKIKVYDIGFSTSSAPWSLLSGETKHYDRSKTYLVGDSKVPEGDGYMIYKGTAISFPIIISHYFPNKQKLKPFISLGVAWNHEIGNPDLKLSSGFLDLESLLSLKKNYPTVYVGTGFDYILTERMKLGLVVDYTVGGKKYSSDFWYWDEYLSNAFLNFSVKYRIK